MKNFIQDIVTRLIKNPVSTLIGIAFILALVMFYKGMMTVEQLAAFATAIAAFVGLLYKGNNNNNTTPTPPTGQ